MALNKEIHYEKTGFSAIFDKYMNPLWNDNTDLFVEFMRDSTADELFFSKGFPDETLSHELKLGGKTYLAVLETVNNNICVCRLYPEIVKDMRVVRAFDDDLSVIELNSSFLIATARVALNSVRAGDTDGIDGILKSYLKGAESLYDGVKNIRCVLKTNRRSEYCEFRSKYLRTISSLERISDRLGLDAVISMRVDEKYVRICYSIFERVVYGIAKIVFSISDRKHTIYIDVRSADARKLTLSASVFINNKLLLNEIMSDSLIVEKAVEQIKGTYETEYKDGKYTVIAEIPIKAANVLRSAVKLSDKGSEVKVVSDEIGSYFHSSSVLPEITYNLNDYELLFASLLLDN